MGNNKSAVEWYRNCIHEKQLKATTLSIEIGLKAQEFEDRSALVEAIECLDTAIGILEQANAAETLTSRGIDDQQEADGAYRPQALMDDLGHSMAPIDLVLPRSRLDLTERAVARLPEELEPSALDWASVPWQDSLRFFA